MILKIIMLVAIGGLAYAIFKPWVSLMSLDDLGDLRYLKEIASELRSIRQVLTEMKEKNMKDG